MASRSAWRDTAWNLAGLALPLPVAVAVVPLLLQGMGDARFGLLTLAWAILGYFTLFDFGLGRATTQGIAQAQAANRSDTLADLCWSSVWAHLALGVAGGVALSVTAAPAAAVLALPAHLADEFHGAMAWLALSIPFIVTATALRGVLEGVGRFDAMNIVRLPSTLWTYLAPLVLVQWTTALPPVIAAVTLGRVLTLAALATACLRAVPALRVPRPPRPATLAPLARLGLWITAATVAVPMMSTLDRFVIGTRVSVDAVGWYAAPYEAVARLWIVSTAVLTVAFPAFTAAMATPGQALARTFRHALAALLLVVFPAAMVIVALAPVAVPWWLDDAGGRATVLVTQWLAVGMAVNVAAQAGATLLQATQRAHRVAQVQVAFVVLYGVAAWWTAGRYGIVGVAAAWVGYGVLMAVTLLALASRWMHRLGSSALALNHWAALVAAAVTCIGWAAWSSTAPTVTPTAGLAGAAVTLAVAAWLWWALVDADLRHSIGTRLRALS